MGLSEKAKKVLKQLGLSDFMVTSEGNSLYHNVSHLYDETIFELYIPEQDNHIGGQERDALNSSRIYGFLHLASGLRCEYRIHELSSTVDIYELHRLFVVTKN